MCRVLGVSPSGYYAWCSRPPSARAQRDQTLLGQIQAIHARSRRTYGAPRIHAELREAGVRCGRKRVARLMKQAGLEGAHHRRKGRTTVRDAAAVPAPDLVARDFAAGQPDHLWVADITYVRTWSGWLYLAAVLDAFSRRVVGWSMQDYLGTELVLDALNTALWNRRPGPGLIHHSDRGTQYTSLALAGGAAWPALPPRWAPAVMPTTTRWPRRSSPPWKRSCSGGRRSRIAAQRGSPCLSTSRPSTTRTGDTQHWDIYPRPSSKGGGGHTLG